MNNMNKITICIYERPDYDKYKHYFDGIENVNVVLGDITNYSCECIATCGNSFGIMDGGLDCVVNNCFDVEKQVQHHIEKYYYGECPIGSSFIVKIQNNSKFKYLCYVPTMRILTDVSDTMNAYYAMRSVIVTCLNCNIKEIIVPTFCGGVGKMSVKESLRQCKEAIISVFGESTYKWSEIIHNHKNLCKRT